MIKNNLILIALFAGTLLEAQTWKFTEQRNGRNVPLVILETYDKGLLFPVYNSDIPSFYDIFLYKLDINGSLLWKKNFQYKNTFFETTTVLALRDGGYIIAGSTDVLDSDPNTQGDPFIVKLNACMEPEWFKIYNEPGKYNRIDHIVEYQGKLLVSFAFLKENYITLALLDQQGRLIKKTTLSDIFTDKILVKKDKTIKIIAFTEVFGLFADPFIGIDKGILIDLDSTLTVKKKVLYHGNDTTFDNVSFDMCYIDSNEQNFLTLGSLRQPNPYNTEIDGSILITKNYDGTGWYKIINDTSKFVSGQNLIKIDNNRFAITSSYNPDFRQPFWGYGQNFIIDSNGAVIYSVFENQGTKNSQTTDIVRTSDGNIVTVGGLNRANNDWDIYCYKYNSDLTPFIRNNVIKKYDTLCAKAVISSTTTLPEPITIFLQNDSFLVGLKHPIIHEKLFSVYPNPARSTVHIEANGSFILTITDYTGETISCEENPKEVTLSPGIYFFQFQSDTETVIKKVVIL